MTLPTIPDLAVLAIGFAVGGALAFMVVDVGRRLALGKDRQP